MIGNSAHIPRLKLHRLSFRNSAHSYIDYHLETRPILVWTVNQKLGPFLYRLPSRNSAHSYIELHRLSFKKLGPLLTIALMSKTRTILPLTFILISETRHCYTHCNPLIFILHQMPNARNSALVHPLPSIDFHTTLQCNWTWYWCQTSFITYIC